MVRYQEATDADEISWEQGWTQGKGWICSTEPHLKVQRDRDNNATKKVKDISIVTWIIS